MTSRLPGLAPGEQVRAAAPASFRGALAASTRALFAFASERSRNRAYEAWERRVSSQFPTAGPEMVIGVTADALVVWHTSFLWNRPVAVAGRIPLGRLYGVSTVRHGIVTGLAIALDDGTIVELEAVRGRRLRRVAAELRAQIARRRPRA